MTDLGKLVLEYLIKHFSIIINITFTASVEEDLDLISMGQCNWKDIIKKWNKCFKKNKIDGTAELIIVKNNPFDNNNDDYD